MAFSFHVFALISLITLIAAIVALVHAAIQPSDAFVAAEKQTKTTWVVILAGAAVLTLIPGLELLTAGIAAVAAGVYFVDVRPRVLEVQGKSR
ncbi:DUF2516 family protein [Mycobacteroides abscessus subsp. abscessus]|uniref:Transmembrane protein n=1 Tax=Mycobacteroides abscessus subsp. abscessus TaxID=1185650 RepID=A0AB38CTY0_9MYCO|nr:DUF2516 family protein [Mycobacteroides abscessus]AMU32581.1 hypothetical protein A3N97_19840 [Mycobacteroides abscessus]MBE5422760.1 hypothetical protein [Mycobacteroides abscessus]MBE5457501.1 hypothetical protein [Mycobacteroides abscessus]MBN7328034.1 DUF2516 family protein [Mycobacteroides abscessus subsp. abscessus]MBN7332228.1 DUF2516 family protein [Mycobacteroides abscessus subsp. abscessus]